MLLGLGIAYGIYLASAFELLRHDYPDDLEGFRQTLAGTLEKMGPGIATGSFTTAAAFATTIFTDFTGVAEMGLIAGVGILLCLVSMFTVFPVLLRLFRPGHKHDHAHGRPVRGFLPAALGHAVCSLSAVTTLAVAAPVVTAASVLVIIFKVRFDFDLLALQPRNAPGMLWVQRIMREGNEQKVWSNLAVVKTLDEGRQLAAEFRAFPTVSDVGGIGMLFPRDEGPKLEILAGARAKLGPALTQALGHDPWASSAKQATTESMPQMQSGTASEASTPAQSAVSGSTLQQTATSEHPNTADSLRSLAVPLSHTGAEGQPDLLAQLNFLRSALASALGMRDIPPPVLAALGQVKTTLVKINDAMAALTPEQRARRVDNLVRGYQAWRLDSARQIAAALDPSPLSFDDLPAGDHEQLPKQPGAIHPGGLSQAAHRSSAAGAQSVGPAVPAAIRGGNQKGRSANQRVDGPDLLVGQVD